MKFNAARRKLLEGEGHARLRECGYGIAQLSSLPEGVLVSIKGKVTSVEKDHYVVTADGATCKVVPATKGDATDAAFNGKTVAVNGCWWKFGEEMRVTWAEVK